MGRNGKEQEPRFFFGGCNFEKAITYVFAESPFRNEVTNNPLTKWLVNERNPLVTDGAG
jgi:hypothetical protein